MTCNKSQVCRLAEVLVLRIATRVHHVKEIGTGETLLANIGREAGVMLREQKLPAGIAKKTPAC